MTLLVIFILIQTHKWLNRADGFGLTVVGSAGHCPSLSVLGTGGRVLSRLLGLGFGMLSLWQSASFVCCPQPSPRLLVGKVSLQGLTAAWDRPSWLGLASAQLRLSGAVGLVRTPSSAVLSGGTWWELGSSPLLCRPTWRPFRICCLRNIWETQFPGAAFPSLDSEGLTLNCLQGAGPSSSTR